VTATRHPRRLGLDERQRRAEIQRAPAPTTVAEIKPRAATPADPTAITLATMRPDRDHDLSLVADKDVLYDRALKPSSLAHTLTPRTSHPLPSIPALKKPEP